MLKMYKRHCCGVSKYTGYSYSTATENLTHSLSTFPAPHLLPSAPRNRYTNDIEHDASLSVWPVLLDIMSSIQYHWFHLFKLILLQDTPPQKRKKKSSQRGLFEFLSKNISPRSTQDFSCGSWVCVVRRPSECGCSFVFSEREKLVNYSSKFLRTTLNSSWNRTPLA